MKHTLFNELADLHVHLASSISPAIYWHIANSEGYKLPKRDYHEFIQHVVLSPQSKMTLKEYLDQIYHPILDKLSSGAIAVERGVYESFIGAYRTSNITVLELRTNPMKHNRDGEVDLDHAIMAMLRGMEKALLEYPKLRGGLIFCLDRQFSYEKNRIIVEKAIKYLRRGIIGIDFSNYNNKTFSLQDYTELITHARKAGLRVTVHSGETEDTNDMWDALKFIKPDRIGHGIKAAYDKNLMRDLVKNNIILEVCPLSNLMTKAVKNDEELKFILQSFVTNNVKFCINTDWPEMIEDAHLIKQYEYLTTHNILTEDQILQTIHWSFEATFIPKKTGETNLYL